MSLHSHFELDLELLDLAGLCALHELLEDFLLGLELLFHDLPLLLAVTLHHLRPLLSLVDHDVLHCRVVDDVVVPADEKRVAYHFPIR